jgi:hypothetical protein
MSNQHVAGCENKVAINHLFFYVDYGAKHVILSFVLKDKIFKFYGSVMNFYCSFSVTAADAEILRC